MGTKGRSSLLRPRLHLAVSPSASELLSGMKHRRFPNAGPGMHCWGSGAPWISAAALGDFHRYVFCGVHDTTTAHITLAYNLLVQAASSQLQTLPSNGEAHVDVPEAIPP